MRPIRMVRRGFGRLIRRPIDPSTTLPNLAGQIAVVTGASAGIGVETAHGLAKAGARVVLVGRNPERTAAVAERVRHATGAEVSHHLCDFADLAGVRDLGDALADLPALHILVNNAGVWHLTQRVSSQGVEATYAVNHLAPFLLTARLRPLLEDSGPARVVTVSSRFHARPPHLPLDDVEAPRRFHGLTAYCNSKLANVMFSKALARRLAGTGVTSCSVHPGDVATEVVRDSPALTAAIAIGRPLLMTPTEGAQTSLYAAAHPETAGQTGLYYADCAVAPSSPASLDEDAQEALWTRSEERVAPFMD